MREERVRVGDRNKFTDTETHRVRHTKCWSGFLICLLTIRMLIARSEREISNYSDQKKNRSTALGLRERKSLSAVKCACFTRPGRIRFPPAVVVKLSSLNFIRLRNNPGGRGHVPRFSNSLQGRNCAFRSRSRFYYRSDIQKQKR